MQRENLQYLINLILKSLIVACLVITLKSYGNSTINNNKIIALTEKLKTAQNTDRVNTLNELCWEYRFVDLEKALSYGEEALALANKLKFNAGAANAYVNMAYINIHLCNYDIASDYYGRAQRIYEKSTNEKKGVINIARIYEGMGLLHFDQQDYEKSIFYYNHALTIYKKYSMHKNISVCYRIIGMIYEKTGNIDKARKSYYAELKNTIKTSDKNILSSYTDFEKINE
jgi:tetratricopeptide (TPR) repeat protein